MSFANLYTSRRKYHLYCAYFLPKQDNEQLVYDDKPSGYFYARYETANAESNENIASVLQIKTSQVVIKTPDYVADITPNTKIVINSKYTYRVEDIQKKPIQRQTEFTTEADVYTYLTLYGN